MAQPYEGAPAPGISRVRVVLAVSIFLLGWVIDLAFGDGLLDTVFLAFGLAIFMGATFVLGVLSERR